MEFFSTILLIFKNWWWFFVPLILIFPLKSLYLWWVRWEVWYKKGKWILLEIKTPEEILKPFRSMEDVIHILWGVYDSHNWRERWCEGGLPSAPYWFSLEIVSIGGEIHFYIRILEVWRNAFESAIYSQYPEAEISVVEDYTKNVPKNIPNEKWDLYGEDLTLIKDEVYPFRTYSMFFEKEAEEKRVLEEKRIDPINSLLEALSKLKSGEQFWLQIVAAPIQDKDIPWKTRGKETIDQIRIYRGAIARKPKPMLQETVDVLFTGKPAGAPKERAKVSIEEEKLIEEKIKLTPGEREVVENIEKKISKQGFKTSIRIIYLYKKDQPYFIGNYKIGRAFFNHFMTENLNTILYFGPTRSRIHYWMGGRRLYLRKRKQFKNYIDRLPSYFPWNLRGEPVHTIFFDAFYPKGPGKWQKGTFVLNAEELATLYHFPSKITVPAVPRVEAKKGGPPSGLPTE